MATRRKYKQKYLRWRKGYERRANKILRAVFKEYGKSINLKGVKMVDLEKHLKDSADIELLYKAYAKIYTEIGMVHKARILKGFKADKKAFPIHDDLQGFEKDVIKYLMKFAGERIVSVHESYLATVRKIITKQVAKEWTIYDVTESLLQDLYKAGAFPWQGRNFYKWQAERIARTETTSSANFAAIQAADDTGFVMVKEWISVGRGYDGRTREHEKGDEFDHVDMDGVQVPRYSKFETFTDNGEKELMNFPGDPNGSAGNVINCRCTVALIGARDKDGNLIPTF